MTDLLVHGGTVVDGTGGPPRRGDVRVRDGLIAEVGPGLQPAGEPVVDAAGALVTPGLIDPHTHYDLEMFWDPTLDPLPSYGMTTAIMGNCGLGLAPSATTSARHRRSAVLHRGAPRVARRVERALGMEDVVGVPRGRVTHADDRHARSRTRRTTRSGATRMGRDAWERAATEPERNLMAELLDDALAHGSLGMSSNWFDTDRNRELVPSRYADDAELDLLFDVLARHPHATFQVIARDAVDRRRVLEKATARRCAGACRSATARAAPNTKKASRCGSSAAAASRSRRCSGSTPASPPPPSPHGTR